MAYENLKTAIKQAIKNNNNQDITGDLLQNTLLNIVNVIGADYKFLGFATPSTVPPTGEEGRLLYFTTGHGDSYINFPTSANNAHITLGYGIYVLTREADSKYWKANALVDIVQELVGEAEDKVMSQKAITTAIAKETTRATETENDLQEKITSEVQARTQNDNLISQNIVKLRDKTPSIEDNSNADLDIKDENGYVLARFSNGHIKTKEFDSEYVVNNKKYIKLVAIGNSYARDAYSYVPYILQNILGAEKIDITIGIVYKGSCTLQTHWDNIENNNYIYEYDKWDSKNNKWVTVLNKSMLSIIQDEDWDIITLQQQSSRSRDYRTMQPYLNNIIDWLFSNVKKPIKLGWLLTPAYPEGYSGLTDNYGYGSISDTSDTMFEKICVATQSVLNNTAIDFIISAGTAIQNARTTSLDSLGDFGHLSAEGLHLQEGIPCLLEAYVVAKTIISLLGEDLRGIYGDTTRPTQTNIISWNVPQRNGNSVGVTEDNVKLAQKIVSMVMKKPLEKTDCGSIF